MRLIIEADDFRKLSRSTQRELIEQFAGARLVAGHTPPRPGPVERGPSYEWRRPVDLTHELTIQLMHGLGEPHRRRLALFARRGGSVTMKQLLKVTSDDDPKVLSYFQSVVTRKLRRIIGDEEKQALLITWDYESTKWDRTHTHIVDGIYYISDESAAMLREYFGFDVTRYGP